MAMYGTVERVIKNENKSEWVCQHCGGTKIEKRAWVDVNALEWVEDCDGGDGEDIYCRSCTDYVHVITREEWRAEQEEILDEVVVEDGDKY